MARSERGPDLRPAGDDGWHGFVLSWADDEILTAHLLADLLGGWSEVEDLIAVASIAQDDLAHANQLYGLLEPDPRERDRLFFERPATEFRNAQLTAVVTEQWGTIVARQYLYELADALRVEQVLNLNPPKPLADLVRVIRPEEGAHQQHWQRWCRVLANTDEGRSRLTTGIHAAWDVAGDLLAVPIECTSLSWPCQALTDRWSTEARRFLTGLGINVPDAAPTAPARARCGDQPAALLDKLARSRRVYELDTSATWG